MTGNEQYILTTAFLSGQLIDETMFYQLLNMKKNMLEMSRDWMILRTLDTSITFTTSDDYTSTKTLPSRFLRTYVYQDSQGEFRGPYLVLSNGSKLPLRPIKFEERFDYKDTEGYYYIDVKNSKIGRTGTTAGTLHLPFIQGTEDIDEDATWTFPSYAHPLLSYEVAVEQKGGIDWDTINAQQVPFNEKTINAIMSRLNLWDAMLQQQALGV